MNYNIVTILGPTATGKTALAAHLAYKIGGEIISADSRQVYKGMTVGTGKDLNEYIINGSQIPTYLIDIVNAGYKYNVFEYQRDFLKAYKKRTEKKAFPILCGGTGLYIEAVLKKYKLIQVPDNLLLREQLQGKTLPELEAILSTYKTLHNKTDVDTVKRAIRAIEIAEYYRTHEYENVEDYPELRPLIVGIDIGREERRHRITMRLIKRLEQEGLVEEVKGLLNQGIIPEDLIYYGLEYKYLTLYLIGKLKYSEMVSQLEVAIHQFAKRQMTWFRGMERRGFDIRWIDVNLSMNEKVAQIIEWIKNKRE